MDHGTAQVLDALKRGGKIGNREVGQRRGVAWTRAALVHTEAELTAFGLPARPRVASARSEIRIEHTSPEPQGALRIVSRKLDQRRPHDGSMGGREARCSRESG